MPKIAVVHSNELEWIVSDPEPGKATSLGAKRYRHDGSEEEPQLIDVRVFPNEKLPVHAHESGEFFYILKGEMHFGQHVLQPGDSIYIPAHTLYSLKAGSEGVEFLNFRPCHDRSHLTRSEVLARQAVT